MADARVIPIKGTQGKSKAGKKSEQKGNTKKIPAKNSNTNTSRGSSGAAAAATAEELFEEVEHEPLPGTEAAPIPVSEKVAEFLAFLRRRVTGEYEVDEFGFDRELSEKVLSVPFRQLYKRWFRIETRGLENIPDEGGALIVCNHSGTIALDGMMTALAIGDHHPAGRTLRLLGANIVFQSPILSELGRKSGATLACAPDAERLLNSGELVGVWPEGFKGIGKPYSERYKLQRFGRGGFVASAIKTGTPIIPCAIVGAEETYPILGNSKMLARLLGLPYFPITPTFPHFGPLGLIPIPSKWIIEFGEPIYTDNLDDSIDDDPMLVFNLTDQVRETIQHTLYKLLVQRRSIFM